MEEEPKGQENPGSAESQTEETQEGSGWLQKIKIDDFKFELILFFVLGLLLGFTLKSEAIKKITIGFNDYKISQVKQGFDFEQLKKGLEEKAKAQQPQGSETQPGQ